MLLGNTGHVSEWFCKALFIQPVNMYMLAVVLVLDLYVEWICDLCDRCLCSWLWAAVPAVGGRWKMTSPPQMDALGCCTPVARGCRCAALMVKLSPSSRSQTRAMVSPPTSVWAQMPSSSLISLPPAPSPPPATVRPLTRACASVFVMNRRALL